MKAPDFDPSWIDPSRFDSASGNWLERALFNHRAIILALCAVATVVFGWKATHLTLQAGFERMLPTGHPYIQNYIANKQELKGLGNVVRIAVHSENGTIFDAAYMKTLQQINDEVYLIPGVDRLFMKSLWTPVVRWAEVTLEGSTGGPVIPDGYNGSAESLEALRANIARSGEVGTLVAADFQSSIILVPILDKLPDGSAIDYKAFSEALESIRSQYDTQGVDLHITGFAKIVGDLIEGLKEIIAFFGLAVVIVTLVLLWYTRCIRSTILVVACSVVAVVWLMGLLPTLGYSLDPYSILVPFLVFAIGMSHGAQKMNGIMQDIGRGIPKLIAARFTFRRLFMAGLTALLADAVGFAALMVIDIPVIRDLAVTASIGVFVLIFTNLVLLPILLSYVGVSPLAAARSVASEKAESDADAIRDPLWAFLDRFTTRSWAVPTLVMGVLMAAGGFLVSLDLKIGDLDPGAPELRPDSRYNRDNAYLTSHYAASSDVMALMVKTKDFECLQLDTVLKLDTLQWELRQIQGVEGVESVSNLIQRNSAAYNEGYLKWYGIRPNQDSINDTTARSLDGYFNASCNLLVMFVYLADHKAETLTRVVEHADAFSRLHSTEDVKFLLAAGNAGIEAATNIVVKQANVQMLGLVYLAVTILCFIAFRSIKAVICAVLPLMLTSILCEALMVWLGIGVKVATLPVIALGVGIGVDYALYILAVTLTQLRAGESLSASYYHALKFTGRVVVLTGITLAIAVATWAFSPIKFQADMGILLAFMFLWNMLGALVFLPALAHFLLKPTARTEAAPNPPVEQVSRA